MTDGRLRRSISAVIGLFVLGCGVTGCAALIDHPTATIIVANSASVTQWND